MIAARLLRAAAAACLLAIPLGILGRSPIAAPLLVLVLDGSPSFRESYPGFSEEARRLWKSLPGSPRPILVAGEHPRPAGSPPAPDRFTDLPAALRAAAALAPEGVEARILLATDGLSRPEGEGETIARLRDRGARVWALAPPLPAPVARAVTIAAPPSVFLSEPFTVRVEVDATAPGTYPVELERDGAAIASGTATVDRGGRGAVSFPQELDRVGRTRYAARVAGADHPPAAAEVAVAEAPRVRWLTDDPGAAGSLVGLLRATGIPVEISHPADLSFPEGDLARDEVIVLDDVPAAAVSESLAAAVRGAVGGRGAGLVVIGGRKGLGAGGYPQTALGGLLPVRPGYRAPPPPESVSLVLVLDTSFSMYYRGSGEKVFYSAEPRKIDVAKESAKEVVRIVRPGDRLGILGNSDDIFWIAPLGEVTDRDAVLARIDRIFPEGDGIYFYSVIHEAREALRRVPGGLRHVLVLCDAEDIDQYEVAGRGHSFDLLREMSREGITVSILAIGRPADKDVPFLRTAALLGGGDFYLVPRVVALPRYFVSEYRRLSSSRFLVEEEIPPLVGEEGAAPAGPSLPPLSGMALMTALEGARVPLTALSGAPLLVTAPYGRGRTEVFAGDDGFRWSARWLDAPQGRRFWTRLILDAAPGGERDRAYASTLAATPGGEELRLQVIGRDGALPPWDRLWAVPAEGPPAAAVALERVGLREYRGAALPAPAGYRRVRIAEDAAGERPLFTSGFAAAPAEEELPSPPDWSFVERCLEATGGGWVTSPAQIAPPPGGRLERLRPLLPVALAALGVLLLLGEAGLRAWLED